MRPAVLTLALLFTLFIGLSDAQAQFSLGIHGGYSLDAFNQNGAQKGAYMVGAQARFKLAGLPLIINPGFDYYLNGVPGARSAQFDANALIPLGSSRSGFSPYFGLGLGITRVRLESDRAIVGDLFDVDETNSGVNLLAGAVLGRGPIRLFTQARYTLGEHLAFANSRREGDRGLAVMAGLLFRVGR